MERVTRNAKVWLSAATAAIARKGGSRMASRLGIANNGIDLRTSFPARQEPRTCGFEDVRGRPLAPDVALGRPLSCHPFAIN